MAIAPRFPESRQGEKVELVLDPLTIGELYYRCPRCLYRHVRQQAAVSDPATFFESAAEIIEKSVIDGQFFVGSELVTLLGHRIPFSSAAITLEHSACSVRFEGIIPALLSLPGSGKLIAWYEKLVEVERRHQARDFVYQAMAYALAHPLDTATEPIETDGTAIVSFNEIREQTPRGRQALSLRPISMKIRPGDDERCRTTAKVIARVVTSSHAPPSAEGCRGCHKAARVE